jgi:hypothetical protein
MNIILNKGDKVKIIDSIGVKYIGDIIKKINEGLYQIEFFNSDYEAYVREVVENKQIESVYVYDNKKKIEIEYKIQDNQDYGYFIYID